MRGKPSTRAKMAVAIVVCIAAVLIALASCSGSAGAATYSASVRLLAQPSSNFAGSEGGGDGWAVALSSSRLYNVFHHAGSLGVACHVQADASACPGYPKTITDSAADNFATSIAPGLYLNQANGHLYVPVVRRSEERRVGKECRS